MQQGKQRVAVLFGSRSVEHEVSIVTALQAIDAMDPLKYEPIPIYISKSGEWFTGRELTNVEFFKEQEYIPRRCRRVYLKPEPADGKLYVEESGPLGTTRTRTGRVDVLFPIVHGTFGEDGTLQGLFELADVPYVGAGVVGSAVGMDKIVMKAAFRTAGLPTVDYVPLLRSRWDAQREAVLDEILGQLQPPYFVKPANLGSSIGITKATDRDSLANALDVAAAYDRRLLVEQAFEDGTEINCAVLGNDDPIASVCEEPVRWTEILSYEDKYLRGGGKGAKGGKRGGSSGQGMASLDRRIPAPIGDELTSRIQELAIAAFRAIDCAGIARVDFLVQPSTGRVCVNEINTMPGSLAFYLWEASGIPFPRLIDRLIELARQRHAERRRNMTSYDSALLGKFGGGAKGS